MARRKDEEIHQVAFVRWFRLQYPRYQKLMTLGSFGENVGERRMKRLKEMGLTPGYPDLVFNIPVKKNGAFIFGLFIEMKTVKGRVSPAQKEVHTDLIAQGYRVEVAKSWEEAKACLVNYLML